MRATVREPDAVCELLTDASFLAHGGPFRIGRPSDGIFIDAFGLALDKAVTETFEAMYLVRVRGCIIPFKGAGCKRLKGYFPHCYGVGCKRERDADVMEGLADLVPPFFIIFGLDHHFDDWRKLANTCLLSKDEDEMKLLSLRKKKWSFFDMLEVIFGWDAGGVASPQEEELALIPHVRLKGKTRSGSSERRYRDRWIVCLGGHAPPLDSGHGLRSPASRVEVDATLAANTYAASPALLAISALPALKATSNKVGSSRVPSFGSSTAQSYDSQASRGPVENSPLALCAATKAMMAPGSKNHVLDVPPMDVVSFPAALRSSSGFKVSMVRGMLCSGLQAMSLIGARETDGGFHGLCGQSEGFVAQW
ncbi:hypothetical protein AMTR_s00054p00147360 [Amborella trichopoda]|uniref:Uncharacterized protein n=1 Tax=Amborella trichopoda TaxID=13333 RepID=U5D6T3_AMBTC|nr:hypothetical protein AMTR_s00054p00147360 [Amborella trichopoda]